MEPLTTNAITTFVFKTALEKTVKKLTEENVSRKKQLRHKNCNKFRVNHGDLQASLRIQLKKILKTDTTLVAEITQILKAETVRSTGDNIQMQSQSYDQSKFNQVGKIEGKGNVNL